MIKCICQTTVAYERNEVLNYSNNCKHPAYKYAVIKSIYMIFATNLLMAFNYALKDKQCNDDEQLKRVQNTSSVYACFCSVFAYLVEHMGQSCSTALKQGAKCGLRVGENAH